MNSIRWAWRMALRDARHSKLHLLTLVISIVIGISAVVALSGFKQSIAAEIDRQSKRLIGADLIISSRSLFNEEMEAVLNRFEGDRAREITFASMIYFPKSEGTRLVQVNAVSPSFPLYGSLKTDPSAAADAFHEGQGALVDKGLLLQFGAEVGDVLRLGSMEFRIDGVLHQVPGVIEAMSLVAPRVYIPLRYLDDTGLLQRGSRVRSNEYYRFSNPDRSWVVAAANRPLLDEHALSFETVSDRQRRLSRVTDTIARFLSFTAFVALALGGLGVGGAAHLYIRKKSASVAVLRCLGAGSWQTMLIFVFQVIIFGALGIAVGIVTGVGLQLFLPKFLGAFLPVDLEFRWAWTPLLAGAGVGGLLLLLFTVAPIISSRLISPLAVLRIEAARGMKDDPLKLLLWSIVAAGAVCSAWLLSGSWKDAALYSGIVAAALLVFGLLGSLLIACLAKRQFRRGPYAFRQGLANLYRPFNQTRTLIVMIGMATFLLVLTSFSRSLVLQSITVAGSGEEPNIISFDVQTDQLSGMKTLMEDNGLLHVEQVPIVSMRLSKVKGVPVAKLLRQRDSGYPRWSLARTYRSTYRGALSPTEELIQGSFVSAVDDTDSPVPVSLGDTIAERLQVGIGDSLTFDVQGVEIETIVGSLRKIDWQRPRANFFVVFPEGVLEDAPQFFVLTGKATSEEISANFQRSAVRRFPNVSIIDLRLVQNTVDAVLQRLATAVRFLGILCMATAVLVLFGAVLNSKDQRSREYALLKVLGSSRGTILAITALEYGILGALAAVVGVGCAAVGAELLGAFAFEQPVVLDLGSAVAAAALPVIGCMLIGLIASVGTYRSSPSDLLRV